MAKYALPCIACGRELRNVEIGAENQPYAGTSFTSRGHYGSTAYDPMDGRYITVNLCDACLVLHPERVLEGRDRKPVMEDTTLVGWEPCEWHLTPWVMTRTEIDYALGRVLHEAGIEADDEADEPPASDELGTL